MIQANARGLDAVLRELKKLEGRAVDVIQEAFVREAYRVDNASVKQVPVDTGRLRSTHMVVEEQKLRSVGARVVYGGGTGPSTEVTYAREVHDDLRMRHRVGKARYLIDPLEAAKPHVIPRVIRYIKGKLGL